MDQIRPYYPKAGKGRAPYGLESMLRVHCVQLFYNLSDPATEDMLYEIERVRRFTGISLSKAPEEATILNHLRWPQPFTQPAYIFQTDSLKYVGPYFFVALQAVSKRRCAMGKLRKRGRF